MTKKKLHPSPVNFGYVQLCPRMIFKVFKHSISFVYQIVYFAGLKGVHELDMTCHIYQFITTTTTTMEGEIIAGQTKLTAVLSCKTKRYFHEQCSIYCPARKCIIFKSQLSLNKIISATVKEFYVMLFKYKIKDTTQLLTTLNLLNSFFYCNFICIDILLINSFS